MAPFLESWMNTCCRMRLAALPRDLFYRPLRVVRTHLLAVAIASAGFMTGTGTATADQPAIRVMPLGNSITQGYSESYRRPLWIALKQAGIDVDFVGTMNQGYSGQEKYDDYDRDHEGHWGWFSDEVLTRIADWAERSSPDVVLIHLGTNDIGTGQNIAQTVDEIKQIIGELRAQNPGVHVLLAAIIPVTHGLTTGRIGDFNEQLSVLARDLDAADSRVVLVDQFTGFDPFLDTYDGIHPNERGNQKMADNWFAGLNSLLQRHE